MARPRRSTGNASHGLHGARGGDFRNPKLLACMCRQSIFCHQLLRNLSCKRQFEAALYVDLGKLFLFKLYVIAQLIALPHEIRLFGVE